MSPNSSAMRRATASGIDASTVARNPAAATAFFDADRGRLYTAHAVRADIAPGEHVLALTTTLDAAAATETKPISPQDATRRPRTDNRDPWAQ